MRILLITTLAAMPAVSVAQERVLLRVAPPVGQVSPYRADLETRVDVPGTGEFTVAMTMWFTQRVDDIEGDVRVMALAFDSVDASASEFPVPQSVIDSMRGLRGTMRIDSRGRTLEVNIGGAVANPFGSGGPLGFGQALSQVVLPEDEVAVGETWPAVDTLQTAGDGGSMTMYTDLTYRLERVERRAGTRIAVVSATGSISQELEMPGGMSMSTNGSIDGEVHLDLGAGRLTAFSGTVDIVAESPVLSAPISTVVVMRGMLLGG